MRSCSVCGTLSVLGGLVVAPVLEQAATASRLRTMLTGGVQRYSPDSHYPTENMFGSSATENMFTWQVRDRDQRVLVLLEWN